MESTECECKLELCHLLARWPWTNYCVSEIQFSHLSGGSIVKMKLCKLSTQLCCLLMQNKQYMFTTFLALPLLCKKQPSAPFMLTFQRAFPLLDVVIWLSGWPLCLWPDSSCHPGTILHLCVLVLSGLTTLFVKKSIEKHPTSGEVKIRAVRTRFHWQI
jgi:hypothetical protein